MKKILFFLAAFTILATGTASSTYASHCDVQRGDSMWKIAKRYNVLFSEVLKLNRHYIDQDLIHPRDEVQLPAGQGQNTSTPSTSEEQLKPPKSVNQSEQAKQVLALVNKERGKLGISPLALSDELSKVAQVKAQDMADNNYFSHDSPTYGSPFDMMKKFNIKYSYAGENIAAGQKTAEEVMNSWMNSSGHRANILNKNYTQLGVGYVKGGEYGTEWVQQFIRP